MRVPMVPPQLPPPLGGPPMVSQGAGPTAARLTPPMQQYRAVGADKAPLFTLEEKRLVMAGFAQSEGLRGIDAIRKLLVAVGLSVMDEDVAQGCRTIGFDLSQFISQHEFLQLLALLKRMRQEDEGDVANESVSAYAAVVESSLKDRSESDLSARGLGPELSSQFLDPQEALRQPLSGLALTQFCAKFGLSVEEQDLIAGRGNGPLTITFTDFKELLEVGKSKEDKPKLRVDFKTKKAPPAQKKNRKEAVTTFNLGLVSPHHSMRDPGFAAGMSPKGRDLGRVASGSGITPRGLRATSSVPALPAAPVTPGRPSVVAHFPAEAHSLDASVSFLNASMLEDTNPLEGSVLEDSRVPTEDGHDPIDELDPEDRATLEAAYRRRDMAKQKAEERRQQKARLKQLREERRKQKARPKLKGTPRDLFTQTERFIARMEKARELHEEKRREMQARIFIRSDDSDDDADLLPYSSLYQHFGHPRPSPHSHQRGASPSAVQYSAELYDYDVAFTGFLSQAPCTATVRHHRLSPPRSPATPLHHPPDGAPAPRPMEDEEAWEVEEEEPLLPAIFQHLPG